MNMNKTSLKLRDSALAVAVLAASAVLSAQSFHSAPADAAAQENKYMSAADIEAGGKVYQARCAACHGPTAKGQANIPALATGATQAAKPGEVFWYITKGDLNNGMPSWAMLPETDRWQVVSYLKSLGGGGAAATKAAAGAEVKPAPSTTKFEAPDPAPPFTDFRFEKPGLSRKITVADLPKPYATQSAANSPKVVTKPDGVWPKVPEGFKVELYSKDVDGPRMLRTAPNGDIVVAESVKGQVTILHGMTADGKAEKASVYATGLNRPYGIAFYPEGPNPKWLYIGDTDAVVRFPYSNGDLTATGKPEHIADLPHGSSGHWTRDIRFTPDGKKMLVSVGSGSNVDDPDTTPGEKDRADVLEFNPDGSGMSVYAYGIRNCAGEAIHPKTGELWCSVNERDALGDNLVPDYITHVKPGGFYGWPWWYMGANQDPRHAGKHPELKTKAIVPDVLLNPHNASLGIMFYEGNQFPAEYKGDLFAAEHGSWNRSDRVGYELIRVPMTPAGRAKGEYEDFMTGFVLPSGEAWGRPVAVTAASDGSLLVSDDAYDAIWRISYVGAGKSAGK
ncbi:MAG: PQQ-dependent sugar dehydrogenase [Edaphobacter sp.]|uniref:PQQ-dependent sugar dehydrogenase n=1 Tax=Edaphobacter sp. TaxID=1934404 RepID=UPI00238E3044|nr:PQQ-dependent sugar dehydrogenase [Edaphobacter sp.]MDE1176966.1 PQQ-dependent sugar dehydrogenase [Edaphobacter sp.]